MGWQHRRLTKALGLGALLFAACTPDPEPMEEAQFSPDATPEAIYEEICAACHDDPQSKAPPLASMGKKSTASVVFAMTNGKMKGQADGLSFGQAIDLAIYITGEKEPYALSAQDLCQSRDIDFSTEYVATWGFDQQRTAAVGPEISNLTSDNVADLKLKWVFELPQSSDARSQPVITTDTLFVASLDSGLFALDRISGCIKWHMKSDVPLRTALSLGQIDDRPTLFFGDSDAHANAVDGATGELIWRHDMAISEFTMLTGAIVVGDDNFLIVPISLYEVPLAVDPDHECCKAHGAVRRLDAATGETIWTTHMTEPPEPRGLSKAGVQRWGPSGVPVWSTPTIDAARGLVYVGTGQNASAPGTDLSDAIIALDLVSGEMVWHFQALAGDTYNGACSSFPTGSNCPNWAGPDFDFGASVILTRDSGGSEILLAGQKSGDVYALDPEDDGSVIWRTRIGSGSMFGGVHWGMAVAAGKVFAAANDPELPIPGYTAEPGLYALDADTGDTVWEYRVSRGCQSSMRDYFARAEMYPDCSFYYGFSAALSIANDVIFAPALDGKIRAFQISDGELLWEFNTAREFHTTSGGQAHGGAMDNVGVQFAGDMVYMQSGYSLFGQLPGNLLLAFEIAD